MELFFLLLFNVHNIILFKVGIGGMTNIHKYYNTFIEANFMLIFNELFIFKPVYF